jgi:dTDP-4-dehydrorhamnose 3,5-epimerase
MTSAGFRAVSTPLPGLQVLERIGHIDGRGQFRRLFCSSELRALASAFTAVQVNHSMTASAGTARGIHFQHPPHAEDKLVTCVGGAIWDVAVDLRASSPTFKRWHGEVLSAENGRSVLLPKGFGHGFVALADNSSVVYIHSAAYVPEAEGGVHPLDPALAIDWPVPIRELSMKDRQRPFIDSTFPGLDP